MPLLPKMQKATIQGIHNNQKNAKNRQTEMSRVNRASATDKSDCPDELYQPTDGKIMAKAHFFQSRQNIALNGVWEVRNELNKQAPAKAVEACVRAWSAYLFVAEDELY